MDVRSLDLDAIVRLDPGIVEVRFCTARFVV